MSDQHWFDYVYDFASLDSEIVILRRGGWTGHKRIDDLAWRQFMSLNRYNADDTDARRIVALLNHGPEDERPDPPPTVNFDPGAK